MSQPAPPGCMAITRADILLFDTICFTAEWTISGSGVWAPSDSCFLFRPLGHLSSDMSYIIGRGPSPQRHSLDPVLSQVNQAVVIDEIPW